NMPPLKVSAVFDSWMLEAVDGLAPVHVPEGPVIVSLGDQFRQSARCVRFVAFTALKRRVHQADVEEPGRRRRIICGEISILHLAGVTLSVHGDSVSVEANRVGPVNRQNMDVPGIRQSPCDPARCIMISADQNDGYSKLFQPAHLSDEKQAGARVTPVS